MKTKKLFFVVLAMVLAVGGLRAQYADLYYHRVGDTIEWRPSNGFYSWWEFEYFYEHNLGLDVGGGVGGFWSPDADSIIALQRYYTPVPLKIIGVAGSPILIDKHTWSEVFLDRMEDNPQYFYVYDATPTALVRVAEVPWNTLDPHRTLHVIVHTTVDPNVIMTLDSCCLHRPEHRYVPIYEYYFDSAVTVMDSFYVGGSMYNRGYVQVDTPAVQTCYRCAGWRYDGMSSCDSLYQYSTCRPAGVGFYRTYKHDPPAAPIWMTFYFPAGQGVARILLPGLIYPIIEVDTTVPPEGYCPKVENLEVLSVDSLGAMVTWDGFPNYTSITLAYGYINVPPGQWDNVVVTDSSFYRITGLEPSRLYGVRVKAHCDNKETAWSESVRFYVTPDSTAQPDDTTTRVQTALSSLTFLSPNPASNSVEVSSSFGLQNIDIYDQRGILVYSQHAVGHQHWVSLEGFSPGTYIMLIQTFSGTTHKKLVVR